MEGYALDIAIQRLQSSGLAVLITGWVGDQDSSVLKQLRECPAAHQWQVHLDPGHAKKNLVNALNTLFGEKKDSMVSPGAFLFLFCAARSGRRRSTSATSSKCASSFCGGWIVWCPITHKPAELIVLTTNRTTSSGWKPIPSLLLPPNVFSTLLRTALKSHCCSHSSIA
jgi:hypothetical protein